MKTKNYLFLVILLIFTRCNQPSTKGETADSTQHSTDTTVSNVLNPIETVQTDKPVELDESPIDSVTLASPEFDFYAQTLSSDKREAKLVNKLAQLVEQFKSEKYVAIEKSYSFVDSYAIFGGKAREDEIWYYNFNRQLCAFSSTYKSERTTRSEFYLCREGEILALSSDNEFQDEGPRAYTSVRIVSSLCPQCGLTLSKEEEGEVQEYQATVLEQSDLDKYSSDFFNKHEDMLKDFKGATNLTKIGDRYSAFVFVDSDTIKYSIDPNLVKKFFNKSLIQN
jgi:hypothetical protein